MSKPGQPWLSLTPALTLAYEQPSWSLMLSKEPGVFHRRHQRRNGHISPEASLAEAKAARRQQEQKRDEELPVTAKLERFIEENHLAELFGEAFKGPR